jgi:hypothetical protein
MPQDIQAYLRKWLCAGRNFVNKGKQIFHDLHGEVDEPGISFEKFFQGINSFPDLAHAISAHDLEEGAKAFGDSLDLPQDKFVQLMLLIIEYGQTPEGTFQHFVHQITGLNVPKIPRKDTGKASRESTVEFNVYRHPVSRSVKKDEDSTVQAVKVSAGVSKKARAGTLTRRQAVDQRKELHRPLKLTPDKVLVGKRKLSRQGSLDKLLVMGKNVKVDDPTPLPSRKIARRGSLASLLDSQLPKETPTKKDETITAPDDGEMDDALPISRGSLSSVIPVGEAGGGPLVPKVTKPKAEVKKGDCGESKKAKASSQQDLKPPTSSGDDSGDVELLPVGSHAMGVLGIGDCDKV